MQNKIKHHQQQQQIIVRCYATGFLGAYMSPFLYKCTTKTCTMTYQKTKQFINQREASTKPKITLQLLIMHTHTHSWKRNKFKKSMNTSLEQTLLMAKHFSN